MGRVRGRLVSPGGDPFRASLTVTEIDVSPQTPQPETMLSRLTGNTAPIPVTQSSPTRRAAGTVLGRRADRAQRAVDPRRGARSDRSDLVPDPAQPGDRPRRHRALEHGAAGGAGHRRRLRRRDPRAPHLARHRNSQPGARRSARSPRRERRPAAARAQVFDPLQERPLHRIGPRRPHAAAGPLPRGRVPRHRVRHGVGGRAGRRRLDGFARAPGATRRRPDGLGQRRHARTRARRARTPPCRPRTAFAATRPRVCR